MSTVSLTSARGTRGTSLQVITNSFANPRKRHAIVERLQNHTAPTIFNPRCVYDGKAILYSSHALMLADGSTGNFYVSLSDRPLPADPSGSRGVYSIKLSRVAGDPIDFRDLNEFVKRGGQKALTPNIIVGTNILQFLVRQAPNLKYPNNARAFFTEAGKRPIGGGLELWRGYFQSVRPTVGQVLVNVDVSTTAMFRSGELIAVALDFLRESNPRALVLPEGSPRLRELKSFLKNVKVTFAHRKGTKEIRGIIANAGHYPFERESRDGHVIPTTVKDYFQQNYNRTLRFPDIFGIQIGSKKEERAIVVPAELCTIVPGQQYKKKLGPEHTKEMVSFSTQKPHERLDMICGGGGHGGNQQTPVLDYHNSPYLLDAGMVISGQPVSITGRVLSTPDVMYGRDARPVKPASGSWNVLRQQFAIPKPITSWGVIDFSLKAQGREQRAEAFVKLLTDCCKKLGMNVMPPVFQLGNGVSATRDLDEVCRRLVKPGPPGQPPSLPDLILVILPSNAADIRLAVKQWGDVINGISTQCVREDKVTKAVGKNDSQYCNNVALKINAKLGGVNSMPRSSALNKLAAAPYMIVGADIGHPGPGVNTQPSVASLVFSHDRYAVEYSAFIAIQRPRLEKIVFFRDGLSEGEYEAVGKAEIKEIEDAIDAVWTRYKVTSPKPPITFIVVGKRHHVRFFPKQQNEGDRSGNCPAGFVADQGIGNPVAQDFYLQSHGGLLGTSRPSHYVVLRDDIYKGNTDDLQELAFTLCHAYARATRSVSIPAPVYYADIICARGAFHFDPNMRYDDAATVSSGSSNTFDLGAWKNGFRQQHRNMAQKMFFM
ncbi:Piwi-domain-containing protein [Leucogyrophana mollusca]|uniref:Piwi-domain-containing protein n=1 Tax=Leucogyrophana mollusca TaxID=85980 RepID=A0ACB8BY43_9AGAM|nr:Piwi-domain-containing protein [Leucogyrophana mollusca]